MAFGIITIGGEILFGHHEDEYLRGLIEVLGEHGLVLEWTEYVGDEPAHIMNVPKRAFANDDMVFCTGGIDATPDDHIRQCAAAALGAPLELYPETREQITLRVVEPANGDPVKADVSTPENQHHFRMDEFPQGARIILNSYNRIPGFPVAYHRSMPGSPVMAWPMTEWVPDTYCTDQFYRASRKERSFLVFGLPESRLTPPMGRIETEFDGVKALNPPSVGDTAHGERYARSHIDLDVRGSPKVVARTYAMLREDAVVLGGKIFETDASATL